MKSMIMVGIGGFLGSIGRYYTQILFNKIFNNPFPLGTMTANVVGCFIIGIIFALGLRQGSLSNEWKLFLAVGFCGGYTTFSSFSLENLNLVQSGHYMLAIFYTLASVMLGFGATLLAIIIFR